MRIRAISSANNNNCCCCCCSQERKRNKSKSFFSQIGNNSVGKRQLISVPSSKFFSSFDVDDDKHAIYSLLDRNRLSPDKWMFLTQVSF